MFRNLFIKKKLIFFLSIVLILSSFWILGYNHIKKQKNINQHNDIINRDFYHGKTNTYDNLKYIIIPEFDIKRIIYNDAKEETLDKYYVGLVDGDFDSETGNLILAGHNVKHVFNKLHQINIGSKIIIKSKKKYEYIVNNKYETLKNDSSVLKTVTDQKLLTLITCTNDPNKRLIVTAIKKTDYETS